MATRLSRRGPGRPKKGTSPGEPREVRAELVRAAIQLVRKHGELAVTTTALAKTVGISQSGFYQYFTNVDECLGAAAVTFAEEMRFTLRSIREQFFEHVRLDGADVQERLRRAFEHTLRYAVSEPRLVGLMTTFRRFRGHTSPFGIELERVNAQVIDDMVAEVYEAGKSIGLSDVDAPELRVYVQLSLSMWGSALEMMLTDKSLDHAFILDQLARSQHAVLEACLIGPTRRRRRVRLV